MDRLEIIEALKHAPNRLQAALAGLPDAVLRYRPAEGEWSLKEIAGHMRDYSECWETRIYQIWAQNDPPFVPCDGETSVPERGYQDRDVQTIIAEMAASRLRTVDTLSHAVDWSRLGQEPGVGRRSLRQFAVRLIEHDEKHLAQIEALKAAAGAAEARA